eukprot:Skav233573  [mRNA]  locus=scaffold2520:19215:20786:+ [translate_table: standard]
MELEKLEKNLAGRKVLFDILKEWASASFHRQVRETEPPGCAWQSLAMAFQYAKAGMEGLEAEVSAKETAMRRLLVETYASLSMEARRSVAEEKLKCQLSFFKIAGYREVEQVLQHWNWYLYSLTFCGECFVEEGRWAKILEEPVQGTFVVRMPLDSVDLYFLATRLRLRILLLQLFQPALRFGNQGVTLHLVTYGGMWAPLLSTKLWLQEKANLSGSIVQVDSSLKGPMQPFAGKSACVLGYDADKDYHIAAITRLFPLRSVQISRIIARDRDVLALAHHGRHTDQPPFHGIPDKAVEFQILLHLLRLEVGQRLEDLHESLAGRCPRPALEYSGLSPWEDFVFGAPAAWNPESLYASSLPLQEVVALLAEGKRVWTKCWVPVPKGKTDFLPCRVQDFLCLEEVLEEQKEYDLPGRFPEAVTFLGHGASEPRPLKRICSDTVCSWLVLEDFHHRNTELLRLYEGDTAIVSKRLSGKWNGWATGRVIASSQEQSDEGNFNLLLLRPQIWIARIDAARKIQWSWNG